MAFVHGVVHSLCSLPFLSSSSSLSPSQSPASVARPRSRCFALRRLRERSRARLFRAVVEQAAHGASLAYAKEMERLSAKESLLLAFKDAGGFEASVTGRTTDMQQIDVNERIIGLERLNPTPRPTTSPFLEGRWTFEWLGSGGPGLSAAKVIFARFPSSVANLSKVNAILKDGYANVTANLKLLNSIESSFKLSSKLSIEGPVRMKEEYVEGVLDAPKIIEESLPEQLRGAFGQAVSALQRLPLPLRDALANGLKVPLSGAFQRLFMISYLDEEILIIRDTAGVPEVLTRLDAPPALLAEPSTDYES